MTNPLFKANRLFFWKYIILVHIPKFHIQFHIEAAFHLWATLKVLITLVFDNAKVSF